MSENCITAALRRMGYSGDEMTWHGFRSLASTQLNEQGWDNDWIEAQLAHAERNKIRGAYNWAKYIPQRRAMMQSWADYLDELRLNHQPHHVDGAGERASAAAVNAHDLPRRTGAKQKSFATQANLK
jgi:hypothetical protein